MAERAPELMTSSAPLPPPPDAHRARRAGMNPTRSPESDTDGTYVNIPNYTNPPAAVPINTDPQRTGTCLRLDQPFSVVKSASLYLKAPLVQELVTKRHRPADVSSPK